MIKVVTHRLKRPLAAAFIGALTTLAFAPYQYWPMAILSPMLLLLLLEQRSIKQAAWIGFFWGLGQFSTGISWVHVSIDTFGGMPEIATIALLSLLFAYLALYPALFAWLLNRFAAHSGRTRFFIMAPALWLICDLLRGWVFTGFPWLWLGYSQIDSPLASFAPIGGVELLTFLVVLCGSSLAYMVLKRTWRIAMIPLVLLAAGFGLKSAQWVTPDPNRVASIALVQGNIDQALKWLPNQRWPTLMKYVDLSRENWDADVIIWPEAAIPAIEYEVRPFLTNLDHAARINNSSIITGVINLDEQKHFYNSILTLGKTPSDGYHYDIDARYHKHHLLPFGEFVPFESLLRPLAPLFNLPMSSFSAGDYIQPNIIANGFSFAPALCYEIVFGGQVRANVNETTDFILTLSNDAWFGHSIGPLQHMEIAQMRALELGKPVIRSTNNGVTAITDYKGHIAYTIPQFETGVLKADVPTTQGVTPYYIWGSWPLYMWIVVTIGWALRRRYQAVNAQQS
ncbi:apolipoprotein N-acyltransferase [Vibrio tritonius]|uniref:Apolipoprotein N-acyltransferase n=1 Tax=Vibrio tritonius TaxID=1435069 RepID=A0ABS7YNG6_9VIBR|nr:apolipoprotein N-acyltransferase [Vibrio tritonius]MCA2016507.1 apolipoprotein N-acyltransferase [Vibrio tritonius]